MKMMEWQRPSQPGPSFGLPIRFDSLGGRQTMASNAADELEQDHQSAIDQMRS